MASHTSLEAKLLAMIKGGTTHERIVARSKLRTLRRRRGAATIAARARGELTPEDIFAVDDSMHGPSEAEETKDLVFPVGRRRRR